MNRILFPKLQLSLFPEIKSLHIKLLCCLFIYCQCSPNFCYHQIMINITLGSPEILYIVCTLMPSLIYHYMISVVESSHQEKSRCIYDVLVWEHHALKS